MPEPGTICTRCGTQLVGRPRVATIVETVATWFDIEARQLTGRARRHARPRHIAMWLCQRLRPDLSFHQIANRFDRDHTTVMYAVRRMDHVMRGQRADDVWREFTRGGA